MCINNKCDSNSCDSKSIDVDICFILCTVIYEKWQINTLATHHSNMYMVYKTSSTNKILGIVLLSSVVPPVSYFDILKMNDT